jgi:hypothetical protein
VRCVCGGGGGICAVAVCLCGSVIAWAAGYCILVHMILCNFLPLLCCVILLLRLVVLVCLPACQYVRAYPPPTHPLPHPLHQRTACLCPLLYVFSPSPPLCAPPQVCLSAPESKGKYIKIILALLQSPSSAVVYECAVTLTKLSQAPTAIRAAANCYCQVM